MKAIRIRTQLGSDTIRIPELQPLIGKDVEITVREETRQPCKTLLEFLQSFDHMPVDPDALEQLRKDSTI